MGAVRTRVYVCVCAQQVAVVHTSAHHCSHSAPVPTRIVDPDRAGALLCGAACVQPSRGCAGAAGARSVSAGRSRPLSSTTTGRWSGAPAPSTSGPASVGAGSRGRQGSTPKVDSWNRGYISQLRRNHQEQQVQELQQQLAQLQQQQLLQQQQQPQASASHGQLHGAQVRASVCERWAWLGLSGDG